MLSRGSAIALIVFASCAILSAQDLTLVYRISAMENGSKSLQDGAKLTVYVQGKKLRTDYEFDTPMGVSRSYRIHRCDLGRVWSLTPMTRDSFYIEYLIPTGADRQRLPFHLLHPQSGSEAANYPVSVTWERTADTKDAFGFRARRYQRVVDERGAEPLKLGATKTVESVWYLEIPSIAPCYNEAPPPEFSGQPNRSVRQRIRVDLQQTGEAPDGIELRNEQTTTKTVPWRDPSTYPSQESKFVIELVELKQGSLDSRLFEVPPGFRLASSQRR